ncbi:MAG TPA: recombination-associated protein RdgC [Polyangiaceae bacterium]|nr:recombination-associated protein RdgC [Polyangiaceae bacterium]
MSARRGSLTLVRYFVDGQPPRDLRKRYLEAVRLRAFQPLKPEDEATEATGWCVMERPLDLEFELDKLFNDRLLQLGLRVDKFRIPSSAINAELADEERKLLTKTGAEKISRQQRKELKKRVVVKLRRKLVPISRAFDLCWDLDAGVVFFFSHSRRLGEELCALFEKTFQLRLIEDSPYVVAKRAKLPATILKALDRVMPVSYVNGRKQLGLPDAAPEPATALVAGSPSPKPRPADPVDAEPTSETGADEGSRAGAEKKPPAAKKAASDKAGGAEKVDPEEDALSTRVETTRFLGPEFLLWLWLRAELTQGPFSLGEHGEYEVWLDRQITLQSALDANERVTVRGSAPSDSSEAREAVKAQKFPVRARVVMQSTEPEFACVLDALRYALATAQVPAVLTQEPEQAFLERMELLLRLFAILDGLYAQFLQDRLSDTWSRGYEPALVAWFESQAVPARVLKHLAKDISTAPQKKRRRSA